MLAGSGETSGETLVCHIARLVFELRDYGHLESVDALKNIRVEEAGHVLYRVPDSAFVDKSWAERADCRGIVRRGCGSRAGGSSA